jgi:hypothetical protein
MAWRRRFKQTCFFTLVIVNCQIANVRGIKEIPISTQNLFAGVVVFLTSNSPSCSFIKRAAYSQAIMIPLRGLVAVALLVRAAFAVCEIECIGISNLLSSCSLPPLSTGTRTFSNNAAHRNISGLPSVVPWDAGPYTSGLKTYADAQCLCFDYITNRPSCETCVNRAPRGDSNEREVLNMYGDDCRAFGYFAPGDQQIAYPSTTRTDMPTMTSPPGGGAPEDDGEPDESEDDDCVDICGAIEAQIDECGLTPLDTDSPPPFVDSTPPPFVNYHPGGSVVLNRTAAECMCTLPMLRRFPGCNLCLGPETGSILGLYHGDCGRMGYWGEPPYVLPESEDMLDPGTTSAPVDATGGRPNGGVKEPRGFLSLRSAAMLSTLLLLL